MNTFTKLKSGEWGVRADHAIEPGQTVLVTKKDGSTKTETVDTVVWTDHETVWLCAIISASRPTPAGCGPAVRRPASRPVSRAWRPCGYPGCNPNFCDECDGEGYRGGR